MTALVAGHVISVLLFLLFLFLLVGGLVVRSKKMVLSGVVAFLLAAGILTYTTIVAAQKAFNAIGSIKNPFRGRTGNEIYTALLGKPDADCVHVLHYQDAEVPVIDYAIVLHFKTCPQELHRLILQKSFIEKREKSSSELIQTGVALDWFRTDTLGDSVNVFTALNKDDASGQIIYSSLDSTKVLLVDYSK